MSASVAVALVAAVVALTAVAWAVLSRSGVARRIAVVTTRLSDDRSADNAPDGTEGRINRLERAAEQMVTRAGAARISVERLERALGSVSQGVVVCDERGEVVYCNEHAAPFVGARHSDFLAERAVNELLQDAIDGRSQSRTLDLYGPPRRTLTVVSIPLDDGWRSIGGAVVIEDVSERRRLEAMRRDFVANISHELKTPVGALGLLAETLGGEDDPDVVRRLAARMQLESQRVARIIDDLLDLSRIESEEAPLREPVPVHLVVAQAVERVRAAADQRGITIDAPEAPHRMTLLGDRRQLVSAVYNLLENAVKYSDARSSVEVGAHTDGRWVELVVRDHGIGIPGRDLERIFERFYRVDQGRSRDTGGTGLGLAIVRHVAANHRGEVHVESKEGEGSTFTLRLPAGPGPVAVTQAEASAAERGDMAG
jgi:two-component system sensor histidine kinase SenX3